MQATDRVVAIEVAVRSSAHVAMLINIFNEACG
jgi:hypothetical protein